MIIIYNKMRKKCTLISISKKIRRGEYCLYVLGFCNGVSEGHLDERKRSIRHAGWIFLECVSPLRHHFYHVVPCGDKPLSSDSYVTLRKVRIVRGSLPSERQVHSALYGSYSIKIYYFISQEKYALDIYF